jgi:calcineurin-like phosphoesterase family protein
MNEVLIKNINQRVQPDDILFHLGDFAFYGKERGITCAKTKGEQFLSQIQGKVILIQGNHDKNNRVKPFMLGSVISLPIIGKATMSHYPSTDEHCPFTFDKGILNYHLCGHVHDAWKHYYDKEKNVLNINVGVDIWNYQVVSEQEIIKYIKEVKNELSI